MGQRKVEPNQNAGILIRLSRREKFPKSKTPSGGDTTAISKLRKSLVKLTGITDDPFKPINEADGWKPRFKLIDDRRNADDRAKKRAIHVPLDEARDFDDENDSVGKWLKENDV